MADVGLDGLDWARSEISRETNTINNVSELAARKFFVPRGREIFEMALFESLC
jgi:hypothetical protein